MSDRDVAIATIKTEHRSLAAVLHTLQELLGKQVTNCEQYLLERSRDVIPEADWARIAAAFDENEDSLFGDHRRDEFGRLYHRIVLLAPRKLKPALNRANQAL